MALSYKFRGSFANLWMPVTEEFLETLRKAYPTIFDVFETFNFETIRQKITTKVNAWCAPVLPDGRRGCLSNRGRRPEDVLLMFKICLIQRLLGCSDAEMECRMNTDLSLRYLLDFDPNSAIYKAPSQKTIWKYRDIFIQSGVFEEFNLDTMAAIAAQPLVESDDARVIDSSFVEAPIQRNTREENQAIKDGDGDKLWLDQPRKKCQKDIDARWTQKGGKRFFGYKLHIKISAATKLILSAIITAANVHDSQVIAPLLNATDAWKTLYADSGYRGQEQEAIVRFFGMTPCFCERAYRGHPLSAEQKNENTKKSSVRCRIEHTFGFIENSMGGSTVRSIGMKRAVGLQHLTVLAYNLHRLSQLVRGKAIVPVTLRLNEAQQDLSPG